MENDLIKKWKNVLDYSSVTIPPLKKDEREKYSILFEEWEKTIIEQRCYSRDEPQKGICNIRRYGKPIVSQTEILDNIFELDYWK